MEVQVLQGVNLENPVTTVKITLDKAPGENLNQMLEMIKGFHEIFIVDFEVKENLISIQSKLPHLWKECAEAFNNLATGEWDEKKTKDFVLNIAIKGQVNSMSTIPMLHAAMEMGYEITQMFISEGIDYYEPGKPTAWNRRYAIGIGQETTLIASISTTGDSYVAQKVQKDKWSTNTTVSRMALPIAPWEVVESEEQLEKAFENYEKPVVIKPAGLTGGSGVTTNITTIEHAKKAFKYAKGKIEDKQRPSWQQKVMIQQQVEGDDYRILVIGGELRIATKRIPAYVMGDGKSTIKKLIEETNKDPRRDLTNPAHTLKPIQFDEMLDEYLAEQELKLDHIPNKGEMIQVRKVASMSQGGVTADFTDKVHPQIKYICESLAQSLKAHVLGVDVICKNITRPLTIENGSFIEMNTMPEAYLNAFPTEGRQYPEIGKMVLRGLMDERKRTLKVVVIGHKREEIEQLLIENGADLEKERIGMYSAGSIYINNELINSGLETWRAVEGLKVNGSLSMIVLHYPTLEEVQASGLGFDNIDLLISNIDIPELDVYGDELIGRVITEG